MSGYIQFEEHEHVQFKENTVEEYDVKKRNISQNRFAGGPINPSLLRYYMDHGGAC